MANSSSLRWGAGCCGTRAGVGGTISDTAGCACLLLGLAITSGLSALESSLEDMAFPSVAVEVT